MAKRKKVIVNRGGMSHQEAEWAMLMALQQLGLHGNNNPGDMVAVQKAAWALQQGLAQNRQALARQGSVPTRQGSVPTQQGLAQNRRTLAGFGLGSAKNRQVVDSPAALAFLKENRKKFGKSAQVRVEEGSSGQDVFSVIAPDTKANRKKAKTLGRRRGNRVAFDPRQSSQVWGPSEPPTSPVDQLIRETDAAQKEAKKASEDQAKEISSDRLKLLKTALGGLKGIGAKERADILRRGKAAEGSVSQDVVSRGLSGTTVRSNLMEGVRKQTDESLLGLNESMRQQLLGVLMPASEQYLAFQERVSHVGPDLGGLADLAGQAGEYGSGGLTGTPPPNLQGQGAGGGQQVLSPAAQIGGSGGFNGRDMPMPTPPGQHTGTEQNKARWAAYKQAMKQWQEQENRRAERGQRDKNQEAWDLVEEESVLRTLPPGQVPPNPNVMTNGRAPDPLPPGAEWVKQGDRWLLIQRVSPATQQRLDLEMETQAGGDFGSIIDSVFSDLFGDSSGAAATPQKTDAERRAEAAGNWPEPVEDPWNKLGTGRGETMNETPGPMSATLGSRGFSLAGQAPGPGESPQTPIMAPFEPPLLDPRRRQPLQPDVRTGVQTPGRAVDFGQRGLGQPPPRFPGAQQKPGAILGGQPMPYVPRGGFTGNNPGGPVFGQRNLHKLPVRSIGRNGIRRRTMLR